VSGEIGASGTRMMGVHAVVAAAPRRRPRFEETTGAHVPLVDG
jgi:hypothetical protein